MANERRRLLMERFERSMELPLIILAVLMVPLLLLPFVVRLSPAWEQTFVALDWLIWAVFALDLLVRTFLSDRRAAYLRSHWLDVLIVIVPFLRPFRLLRLARVVGAMRIVRAGILVARAVQGIRRVFHAPQLVLGAAILTITIAVLVYLVEKDADGSTINSVPNALWWGIVTIATVGYGDTYPITPAGRALAVILLVGGITLFSALSAALAAFLLSGGKEEEKKSEGDAATLATINERLERLERLLQERRDSERTEQDLIR